jgi:thioredoxin reductase (NADPH)
MVEKRDLIIVGAGPGGLTAGLYGARMGLNVTILDKGIAGGQMMNAWLVENYPGFESIRGSELSSKMREQTIKAGAEIREITTVEKFKLEGKEKIAITSSGEEYHAPAIILAMGASDAELGVPGESKYAGRGVSYCATCDGPLFREMTTVVVGGGNTAAMDALFLNNIAQKVYLVHRRDKLRADQTYADRLMKLPNVEILWDTIVVEILGEETVTGVKLRNKKTGKEWIQSTNGVFIAVGSRPNNSTIEPTSIKLDNAGNIIVDENKQTSIPGVYAIGDITGDPRQIVRACGDAVVAVTHWLKVKQP